MKINVVLVEPEIPSNTGNISRTCSVIGAALHLVHPLGFDISDKQVSGPDWITGTSWRYMNMIRSAKSWISIRKAISIFARQRLRRRIRIWIM